MSTEKQPQKQVQEDGMSQEQMERMKRYEEERKKRVKELSDVLSYLTGTVGLKMHKGLFQREKSLEYFRGVNFHVMVLSHKEKILPMIPSIQKDGHVTKLDTIEDSIKLGQQMLNFRVIIQMRKDPGMIHSNEKIPKYVVQAPHDMPMTDKGLFMIVDTTTQGTQTLYLVIVVVVILMLMCFRLWPLWLKKGIWYISFYLLVFLIVTAILRLILWGILYHFGLEFWLFPNYFIDSNDPRDSFLPVYSFEVRDDMFDFRSIIFRLLSGSLLVYMCYQFCQDEKNIEDLKDLAENGLSDLFEYGQEFMVGGNALGDNSKKNETEEDKKKEETFQEKYRRELQKDFDDLIKEEEDDDLGTDNETATADSALGESEEPEVK